MSYTLLIGNRAYSSWSLRGWMLFAGFDIPVTTRLAPMRSPAFTALLAEAAPARLVPVVIDTHGPKRQVIWDSIAIAETLAERHPEAGLWPQEATARAAARSLCAEMHSSFTALRSHMTMNIRRRYPGKGRGPGVDADIARIQMLWDWARSHNDGSGPYLFGRYSAADAFFTPVATRFRTYGVELTPANQAYCDALLAHPGFLAWEREALAEPWVIDDYEFTDAQHGAV